MARINRPDRAAGSADIDGSGLVPVGRISGAYGLDGWVNVGSAMVPAESLLDVRQWYLRDGAGWRPARVEAGRRQGKRLVVKLDRGADRDEAEGLAGTEVAIARDEFPSPEPDEYYWADLIGLEVVNLDGVGLGRVRELMETGANDVLVVDGAEVRLIPFVPGRTVRKVDLEKRSISVDWDPEFG